MAENPRENTWRNFQFPESNVALAERSAYNSDSNFTRAWRSHHHLLYYKSLSCFPTNSRCILVQRNKDPSVLEINRKLNSKAVIDGPLHRMGFPAVLTESFSSMVSKTNRVCDSVKVSLQWLMQLDSYINNADNDSRATTYQPTKHLGNSLF